MKPKVTAVREHMVQGRPLLSVHVVIGRLSVQKHGQGPANIVTNMYHTSEEFLAMGRCAEFAGQIARRLDAGEVPKEGDEWDG